MKIRIEDRIFERFPGLNIGVLVAMGIDNREQNKEVTELIRSEERRIKSEFGSGTLTTNPKIDAWRKAYSSFGAKPKKYHCCTENLYRMILGGIELKAVNKIVDIYTYILIKHMIPVGGDDLDKIDGDIVLKFAKGDEPFTELHKEELKNPKEGEVVYADDKEILCRRWNWRECEKSKMTKETRNVAIVVEGLPPFTKGYIKGIIEELRGLVQKHCGGKCRTLILNEDEKEVEL
jgi:DNA/RNA-binding domain of Phe-tRNA-synthetase-like protein